MRLGGRDIALLDLPPAIENNNYYCHIYLCGCN